MICNVCGANKATVHVTEFVNGEVVEVHMCDKCSTEKELNTQLPFSLSDVLSGLIQFTSKSLDAEQPIQAYCPGCRLGIEDIKKSGKVGCGQCYETFSKFLIPLISKVQGATQHKGKVILVGKKGADLQTHRDIEQLEAKLKDQIEGEDYEEAALTRDKIKILQNRLTQKKAPAKKRTRKTKKKSK